jgi:ComF family protein
MSFLEAAIGWIAPSECVGCGAEGSSLCLACTFSEITPYGEKCFRCARLSIRSKTCPTCRASGAPGFVWVHTDYEATAKNLVQKYKFAHQRSAATDISRMMAETFLAQNEDAQISKKNYLLVPVPTASSRVRQRSFDHSALLAKSASKALGLDCRQALGRQNQNKQVGSSRRERVRQVKGAYFVKNEILIRRRNILLVDDVVTTGATLGEAARVLREAGARSVDALVFAKRL